MRSYELVTIFTPDTSDDGVPATIEKTHQLIQNKGGTIIDVQRWGRRKLSYSIDHHTEGHYVLTRFTLDPHLMSELDSELQVSEDVIRHLIVGVEAKESDSSEPSTEVEEDDTEAKGAS